MARKWKTAMLLALALCLLSAVALAVDGPEGLGYGFNPTGLPIVDEEITIKVLYDRSAQHGDFDKYWFIDYVAEKTGIRLEFEQVESAAWNERLAVSFASDSYPDVFMHGLSAQQIAKYAAEGYLDVYRRQPRDAAVHPAHRDDDADSERGAGSVRRL